MNIELVRLTHEYKQQLIEMSEEWKEDIAVHFVWIKIATFL